MQVLISFFLKIEKTEREENVELRKNIWPQQRGQQR